MTNVVGYQFPFAYGNFWKKQENNVWFRKWGYCWAMVKCRCFERRQVKSVLLLVCWISFLLYYCPLGEPFSFRLCLVGCIVTFKNVSKQRIIQCYLKRLLLKLLHHKLEWFYMLEVIKSHEHDDTKCHAILFHFVSGHATRIATLSQRC